MRSPSTDTLESPLSADFRFGRSGRNPDGTPPVGGLRMSQEYFHRPVMAAEIVEALATVPPGVVVDATVGGGGHSRLLLEARRDIVLVGIDRDRAAIGAAEMALAPFADRAHVVRARFDSLSEVVASTGGGPVSGVLFDLGVSSPQLDQPGRGFSYRLSGPLDMRMDAQSGGTTAADVVNGYSEEALTELFAANGETRFAARIARAIRAARPLDDTVALAEVVRSAIPAATRRTGGHPAKRVFQAIRIEVNQELEMLGTALDAALALLIPGGRCCVLAYHSGEDRLVKRRFQVAATGGCVCPPGLPCGCGAVVQFRLAHRGASRPSATEQGENPRAGSARLRTIERLKDS